MADQHLHLSGATLDEPHWSAQDDDDFDADAMERALLEARSREYAALAALDAA